LSAMFRNSEKNLGEAGFTLLEILVALSLLTILAGALYGSYFALIKGREKAVAGMESRRELRTTLDLLRRELSAIVYRKNDKRTRFVVEDRDLFAKPASVLAFIAIAPPEGSGTALSDLAELKYQPEEDNGNMLLFRQAKDIHFSGDPFRYPQMEQVEGFLVECLSGDKWVKSWDTDINTNLPAAVRVTITVREGDRPVEYSIIATPRMTSS